METQEDILNLETGEKEAVSLKPAKVKIEKVVVQEVGTKGNKKLVCSVKHPDKDESISISAVKYEGTKGKLTISGLWVNLDEDKKIRKGTALANFISYLECKIPKELEGKEIDTVEDDSGYLVFKAY